MSALGTDDLDALTEDLAARDLTGVAIICGCDESTLWRTNSLDGVSRWHGEVFEMPEAGRLLAMCPDCANIRNVGIRPCIKDDERYTLRFELGEIVLAAEDAAEGTMSMFNRRLEEAVGLDPDRLISCFECTEPLYRADKTSGPEAPEIGWEYYECSACNARFNPTRVEGRQ
jgi:hypothetical protein